MSDDKVRDALAEVCNPWFTDLTEVGAPVYKVRSAKEIADAILASDVLATIKADAQREVVDAVEASDDLVLVGSLALMDALLETLTEHITITETDPPGDIQPYIWCTCGFRSDAAGGDQESAGRITITHLANVLHAAAIVALRPKITAMVAKALAPYRAEGSA